MAKKSSVIPASANKKGPIKSPRSDSNKKSLSPNNSKLIGIIFVAIIAIIAGIQIFYMTHGTISLEKPILDVTPPYLLGWGSQGVKNGAFNEPRDVALDNEGNVFVLDAKNDRIQKFDAQGKFLSLWKSSKDGNSMFSYPNSFALDKKNGDIFLADNKNTSILKFNMDGRFLTKFTGDFRSTQGISLDQEKNVWGVNYGTSKVFKVNPRGDLLKSFGVEGKNKGEINSPTGITFDSDGNLYVSDLGRRLQKFDSNFNLLKIYTPPKTVGSEFSRIAISPKGNVYVTDLNGKVWIFTSDLKLIHRWNDPSQERLGSPIGICIDPKGYVYLANHVDNRILKFGPVDSEVVQQKVALPAVKQKTQIAPVKPLKSEGPQVKVK